MVKWLRSIFKKLKRYETPIFIGTFIIFAAFRIWMITGIPKMLVFGPHDDLYYAKEAHYIIHGQWMGPYSVMTLIKMPFYSFFLIGSFLTGMPLFLNENLFNIAACLVLFFAFSPMIKNRWWRLLLFILLSYCPASLATVWNTRVYREFVYFSLSIFVVAFSIGLFLRLDEKISKLLLWVLGLGVSMGAFMLTREEGVWIYPVLFLLLGSCIVYIWIRIPDKKWLRSVLVLLPILIWYIPIFIVSSLNYSYYGFWGTSEQLAPDLNRVLNTLARIKSSTWYPFVQVTAEARQKAYAASPLFNELKDPLESAVVLWNSADNQTTNQKPKWLLDEYTNGGSEMGSSHFLWLFREVVADAGYYSTGKYPHAFYTELADQLEAACGDGRLDCSPPRTIPQVGAIDPRQVPIIGRMFYEDVFHLLNQENIQINLNTRDWLENDPNFAYFTEFIYNPIKVQGSNSSGNTQYVVYGATDLSIRMLSYKDEIMETIVRVYKRFSLPVFISSLIVWIILLIYSIINKWRGSQTQFWIISIFAFGLFVTRLLTLAIIDATTSVPSSNYGDSTSIYIYLFNFFVVYWVIAQRYRISQK